MVKKILHLSANPKRTSKLRLDEEAREIQSGLERAKRRGDFEIISRQAVRVNDLQRALLDHNPQIVHFSGHGAGSRGLALEDHAGEVQLVSSEALARLFRLFPAIQCVVFNACYSEEQAVAVSKHVDYVVGMNAAVGDRAALKFAVGFYDALGAGRTFEDGFEFGCAAIDLESIPESETPILKTRVSQKRGAVIHASFGEVGGTKSFQPSKRIFISYRRDIEPDEQVALEICEALALEHQVFIDQEETPVGTAWAEKIESEIRQADFLIILLSEQSVQSEMVEAEVRMASGFAQSPEGGPAILPVRLAYRQPFQYPLSAYLNPISWAYWEAKQDTSQLIGELRDAIAGKQLPISQDRDKSELVQRKRKSFFPEPFSSAQPIQLEMPSGTMDSKSPFYIERQSDAKALRTITQSGEGVTIVIKGPRQVGKSSLLIRTLNVAAEVEKKYIYLDFQDFTKSSLQDVDTFFRQFCVFLTHKLGIEDKLSEYWISALGHNLSCTYYIEKYVLPSLSQSLVLAMDEVDKVFDSDFRGDFFGMLRGWHNKRASEPIWRKLDLVLVTSTEPYELIPDLTQSPFNVGEIIELEDFTGEQVTELNRCHGSPLNSREVGELIGLIRGHPFLIRRALYLVATKEVSIFDLFKNATTDRGAFGDHLRRHVALLHDKPTLVEGLLEIINHKTCKNRLVFWRLRGAGLIRTEGRSVVARCKLYEQYLRDSLNV